MFLRLLFLAFSFPLWALAVEVVVSLPPQKYFVQKIGGELVEVTVMVPVGADPHGYSPKPAQMAALSDALLYFSLEAPFEKRWLEKLEAQSRSMKVVDTSEGVERIGREHHHDEHDHGHHDEHGDGDEHDHGHTHGGTNPHIWTSPLAVAVQARNIALALMEADPEHKETYQANYQAFTRELAALDRELAALFDSLPGNRTFLVFHPSWSYLARDYGLTELSIETDGKEPGPKTLGKIITRAKEAGVGAVFIQRGFSKRTAGAVAAPLLCILLLAQ